MTGTASSNIALDVTAETTGIATVNIASSTTDGNVVDVSEYTTLATTIVGSTTATSSLIGGAANDTITGGSDNDTLTGGGGADSLVGDGGNDLFLFLDTEFGSDSTVSGGEDTDTIQLTSAASVVDAEFTNVSSVERLVLGNFTNSVTLNDLAAAAGISSVIGGTGNDTLTIGDDPEGSTITGIHFSSADGNDTFSIGGLTVTGTLSLAGAGDTIQISDGGNISSLNSGGVTTAENIVLDGNGKGSGLGSEITMTVTQHNAFSTIVGVGSADKITLSTTGTLIGDGDIETYVLKDVTDTDSTLDTVFTQVAGNTSVVSGTGDDQVITSATDAVRGALTVNFTSGGTDVISILNSGINGFQKTGAETTWSLDVTKADWSTVTRPGTDYVTVNGFTADSTGEMDLIELTDAGAFAPEVTRNDTDLTGYGEGSIFEIDANDYTIQDFTRLDLVADMLKTLNQVEDGKHYIIIYDGNNSTTAKAGLYVATATEGDGFDFADVDSTNGVVDADNLELLAVFNNVGSNEFESLNFDAYVM